MRLIARFAKEKEKYFEIITVYDECLMKEKLSKDRPLLVSISKEYPAAAWFERKIHDDFGIVILDAEDERPLVHHEHFPKNTFPMRKKFQKKKLPYINNLSKNQENSHGVIIGPTHPYHLESSELQLFDSHETVLHFEMFTFYKYRAIEKMLEGMSLSEARAIIEHISASQTVSYQIALYDIQLQATKKTLPEVLHKRNLFLLELERVINHLSDLSVLCQLVGFKDGSDFFIMFANEAREVMQKITGSRFGFSSVGQESLTFNLEMISDFLYELDKTLLSFEKWIEKRDKVLVDTLLVGQLSKRNVLDYGVVGIMARSCGVRLDCRLDDDFFKNSDFHINVEEAGDTFSRFNIRITEIFSSIRLMKRFMSEDTLPFFMGTVTDGEYYSYVESSAGELMMYIALQEGKIERFFLRDPSILNAQVLYESLKGTKTNQIALVLKSIPLNIAAIDL